MQIDPLVVFFRWLHVITACAVIGCAFFMRVILPIGLRGLEPEAAEAAFLRCRRGFKFVVHPGILLFLISGIYNLLKNRDVYHQMHNTAHSLLMIHVVLALAAWGIMIAFLAGREPFRGFRAWAKVNLVILAIIVAAGSTLKSAREAAMKSAGSGSNQTAGTQR